MDKYGDALFQVVDKIKADESERLPLKMEEVMQYMYVHSELAYACILCTVYIAVHLYIVCIMYVDMGTCECGVDYLIFIIAYCRKSVTPDVHNVADLLDAYIQIGDKFKGPGMTYLAKSLMAISPKDMMQQTKVS